MLLLTVLSFSGRLPGTAFAQDAPNRVKPLFPIRIDHEFPNPAATFEEVRGLLLEHYYATELDEASLFWGAVRGMLAQVSPEENKSLAAIWTPEQYETVHLGLQGVQESIGIKSTFNQADGSLTVTEVLEDGPSEELLQPFDRIVRINGKSLRGLPVKEVESRLHGRPGTRVKLKVVRDVAVFDLVITRAEIKVAPLTVTLLPDQVLLITIKRFSEGVSDDLNRELSQDQAATCRGVVLDLRGNGGGVFGEALKTSECFVAKGKFLLRMVTRGDEVKSYVSTNESPPDVPLAVLVDAGSASASEITAAALHDSADAMLVGEKSFGKGTMEKIFELGNGCRVKFTTAALYAPGGRTWQRTGLLPDFPVQRGGVDLKTTRRYAPERRLQRDHQLGVAHRLVRSAAASN